MPIILIINGRGMRYRIIQSKQNEDKESDVYLRIY